LLQGAGAAMVVPSSLALIREAYPDQERRARAIAVWTIGGSVAAAAGPVAGGALNLVSWRAIFFINLPVATAALALLARTAPSPRRPTPFDWAGQIAAVAAMAALTFGVIRGGDRGFADPLALATLAAAAVSLIVFAATQARGKHPMAPLDLVFSQTMVVSAGTGFAFIGGFSGMVFVYSLYLQQQRGLTSLAVGLAFLPMTALSGFVSLPSARLARRFGPRVPIVGGMALMGTGLAVLAALPTSIPVWLLAVAMIPVGITGPVAMPPTTARLLEGVPADRAGIAGGVFNASRQVGGALAVAIFGALLAQRAQAIAGLRESLAIAAVAALLAAAANLLLRPTSRQP
jgi:MFS transporter, DHA2 family, methylenomycin A resistance protein